MARPPYSTSSVTSCDAAEREVAGNAVVGVTELVDALAPETQLGKLFDGEEVGGPQVRVPIRHARLEARRVDDHFHARSREVVLVELKHATVLQEATADLRDDHVPNGEVDACVSAVDVPIRVHDSFLSCGFICTQSAALGSIGHSPDLS